MRQGWATARVLEGERGGGGEEQPAEPGGACRMEKGLPGRGTGGRDN